MGFETAELTIDLPSKSVSYSTEHLIASSVVLLSFKSALKILSE